jgi:hypothetical protein
MSKKRHASTFKDMLSEPTWSEIDGPKRGAQSVRPGRFNSTGDFFDLSGHVLTCTTSDVTPETAQALVDDGAVIAFEGCGCGGGNGCGPEWFVDDALASVRGGSRPRFVRGYGSPTWIDVWTSDESTVVFAHGDVVWGSLF